METKMSDKPVYQAALEEGLEACEELFERDYFGNHNTTIDALHAIRERFANAAAAYEAQAKRIADLESAVKANHEWHQEYDDYDGYKDSELCTINTAALAASKSREAIEKDEEKEFK